MTSLLIDIYESIVAWIIAIFYDLVELLQDLFIWSFDLVLVTIASLIIAIPVPDFIGNGGLATLFSTLDPSINYFLMRSGVSDCFALLAGGITFRLLRKLVTLGQW